ncbi:MAG: hypothetical protein LKM31_12350 [Sphingobium sp.]|nr:hypothetical protein [Sphingobium sp.]
MDEAVAGHATRIELVLEAGNRLTITDNGRGIPVDPHPKFPWQVGAGSDPHHAAFGRQVQRQGLFHLWRSARRRRFGGERALCRYDGRGRAQPRAVPPAFLEGASAGRAGENRRSAQPAWHICNLCAGR